MANVSRLAWRIKPVLNTPPWELYNDWREHAPQSTCNLNAVIDAVIAFGALDQSVSEASESAVFMDLLSQDRSQIILCVGVVAWPQVLQLALPPPGKNPGCSSWEKTLTVPAGWLLPARNRKMHMNAGQLLLVLHIE